MVGLGADEAVRDPAGQRSSLRAETGQVDRRWAIRSGEDLGVLNGVVPTAVLDHVAAVQSADHLDRFLQHLQPYVGGRPSIAEHRLVQCLTAAQAEREPAVEQYGAGRGGLRDDGRVDPNGGAGDARGHW